MVDLSPKAHKIQVLVGLSAIALIFISLIVTPFATPPPKTQLEQIKQNGVLNVLTLNAASTYYQDVNGLNGFEYKLALLFAEYIGIKLNIITVDHYDDLYSELTYGNGDIAAAGLSVQDPVNYTNILYGPAYHQVTQQLIYRKGKHKRPKSVSQLENGILEAVKGTSHSQILLDIQTKQPELSFQISTENAIEEMIELVDEGLIDYVLADSHEIALQRRFYPELRVAFELGAEKQLRWALRKQTEKSLLKAVTDFFSEIKANGQLEQLVHRYYSHVAKFNYSDIQTFSQRAQDRLPSYREFFINEAKAQDLEWQLLAAIGYQESLWNPKAKSPTGVRGLMMLTRTTAKQMKIKNRLDPEQSIKGGAQYFKRVYNKIPKRIPEPDRTWFALASYNVGFGHLEDARKITEMRDGDPDKWIDVKRNLPLLGRKKWYKKTKYGYARGWEPVKYVENIRKYYDLLIWMDTKQLEEDKVEDIPEPLPEKKLSISPSM